MQEKRNGNAKQVSIGETVFLLMVISSGYLKSMSKSRKNWKWRNKAHKATEIVITISLQLIALRIIHLMQHLCLLSCQNIDFFITENWEKKNKQKRGRNNKMTPTNQHFYPRYFIYIYMGIEYLGTFYLNVYFNPKRIRSLQTSFITRKYFRNTSQINK